MKRGEALEAGQENAGAEQTGEQTAEGLCDQVDQFAVQIVTKIAEMEMALLNLQIN